MKSLVRISLGFAIIFLILISSSYISNYKAENNSKQSDPSSMRLKFSPDGNITFSGLQNSTNIEVTGIDPSTHPNEYFGIEILIRVSLFNDWTNSTNSILNITNHDIMDRTIYFTASGGNKYIKWVFLNFSQLETEREASIVWNTKGKISYQGDWIENQERRALVIPGMTNKLPSSINFHFLSIAFDEEATTKQMEATNWKIDIYSSQGENTNGILFFPLFIGLIVISLFKKRKNQVKHN